MPVFKCKMCGGSLEVTDGMTVCECEYCGTEQTLPAFDNEKKINLFNRAHRLRFKCDFDGAEGIYQNIVSEFPTEAEAYWGLCLCKYGIEYVEDPLTGNKIPTCHRTAYESILNDSDYLSAVKNADSVAKTVYEKEAKAIDVLQQKILAVVKNEKPYDVFICYKETDENKERTPDSVLAQEIYDKLTQNGLKVFFSRITLEDKLGVDYEPYIFAALKSAKVMLVVTTKLEYVESVWVKNEWARFSRLAQKDTSKVLIPCYSNIDPEDLPAMLTTKQSQDMNKLGAMQDLIRGITKIAKEEPKQVVIKETVVQTANASTAPLLKRAALFLEDGDWDNAKDYCNRVLDQDPECAQAYFYLLMAKLGTNDINNVCIDLSNSKDFEKAIRYADEQYKEELLKIKETADKKHLISRMAKVLTEYRKRKNRDNEIKNDLYYTAVVRMEKGDYQKAAEEFKSLKDYKDSAERLKACEAGAIEDRYNKAVQHMNSAVEETDYQKAAEEFKELKDYKDSAEMIEKCQEKINNLMIKSTVYSSIAFLCVILLPILFYMILR